MTLSITTLNTMTFSITTLSTKGLSATLCMNSVEHKWHLALQHKCYYDECHYAECHYHRHPTVIYGHYAECQGLFIVMLNVAVLSVVILNAIMWHDVGTLSASRGLSLTQIVDWGSISTLKRVDNVKRNILNAG
jgi:hypothetical protein